MRQSQKKIAGSKRIVKLEFAFAFCRNMTMTGLKLNLRSTPPNHSTPQELPFQNFYAVVTVCIIVILLNMYAPNQVKKRFRTVTKKNLFKIGDWVGFLKLFEDEGMHKTFSKSLCFYARIITPGLAGACAKS